MNKENEITALLLGAGNFGKHYARILSRINNFKLAGIPRIGTLVLTKTDEEGACGFAAGICEDPDCATERVVGEKCSSKEHVSDLLEKYKPGFIAIAARDKARGDSIHSAYSRLALRYGAVLCEKPFENATGDGASQKMFDDMFGWRNAGLFGIELPMAVIAREIGKTGDLWKRFANAENFEFHWQTERPGNDIVNNLALHPWSLIPEHFTIETARTEHRKNGAFVRLEMTNARTKKPASCTITLEGNGSFRGVALDGRALRVDSDGTEVNLLELNVSMAEALNQPSDSLKGKMLLKVENPLEKNIVAVLRGEPVSGLRRTCESQRFLEMLHGFNSND